ncbi:MAG: hypothetical protein E7167_03875 [Firmicutes bacterium]|nr:hypothetical protein [Bacillota bacterium]
MRKHFNKLYAYLKQNYKRFLWDIAIIVFLIILCYYPFPFVIYRPGGLINLNERINVSDGTKISGSYNMSYVTVARGNLPNILLSFIINDWDLKKEEETLVYDEDYETNLKISQLDLQNSVDVAKLVAFQKAGYNVDISNLQIVVQSIDENAQTDLKVLDKIEKINGIPCLEITDLRAYINTFNIGDKIELEVLTEEEQEIKYAHVYEYENRKVIGITFFEKYTYDTPIDVDFKTKSSESGSSGGLMLTLTIYDQLINADLTKGKTVVGTGTIDKEGNVGAIGGVKYKMLGARNNADVYFVPQDNCEEAKKIYQEYKLDFNLYCVKTIDDAIGYLNSQK